MRFTEAVIYARPLELSALKSYGEMQELNKYSAQLMQTNSKKLLQKGTEI